MNKIRKVYGQLEENLSKFCTQPVHFRSTSIVDKIREETAAHRKSYIFGDGALARIFVYTESFMTASGGFVV